jgi:hypothetical protein
MFTTWSMRFLVLVAVLVTVAVGPATATPITITPNVGLLQVDEGDPGDFDFTVKNVSTVNVTIDQVLGNNRAAFREGDQNDAVFETSLSKNSCAPPPKILLPQGICDFTEHFKTQDLHPGASPTDPDSGRWRVFNRVDFIPMGGMPDLAFGEAFVRVNDPLPTPEPSTLLLLGSSLIGLGAIARRRSRRN